jgi:hypothetical protein
MSFARWAPQQMSQLRLRMPIFPVPAEHPIRNDLVPRAHGELFGVVIVIRRRTNLPAHAKVLR